MSFKSEYHIFTSFVFSKWMLPVGIIMQLCWTFCSLITSLVLFRYSFFSGFWCTKYWPTWEHSSYHPSVSKVVYLSNDLTQAITPTTLLYSFSFFTYQDTISPSFQIWNCLGIPYWEFGLILPKDSNIVIYSKSDMIILCSDVYLLFNDFNNLYSSIYTDLK